MRKKEILCIVFFLVLGAFIGRLLYKEEAGEAVQAPERINDNRQIIETDALQSNASKPRVKFPVDAANDGVLVSFLNAEDLNRYLSQLKDQGHTPLGILDAIHTIKISTDALNALNPLLHIGETSFDYFVQNPKPPSAIHPNLLTKLQAYGATAKVITAGGLNGAGTGKGVIVAVIDSGIGEHPGLEDIVKESVDYIQRSGDIAAAQAHGTAVASVISGDHGIAPDAEILDLRVLDSEGKGTAFDLAQAIIKATELNASIINLSLGFYKDSTVLREAVRFASDRGVLLVGAAGNDGYTQIAYPAAYPEVLSVTAVDGNGHHAQFPNRSESLDFSAPGVGVSVADSESGMKLMSGTSVATPFVSGTLAALLSEDLNRNASDAVQVLRDHLDEGGVSGSDSDYGDGLLAWDRLRERSSEGVHDLAVASIHLDLNAQPGTSAPVEIVLQNRGTEWISEAELTWMHSDNKVETSVISSLGPGQIATRTLYVPIPLKSVKKEVVVAAKIDFPTRNKDIRPENNTRMVRFVPANEE